MEIRKETDGTALRFTLSGRLDTLSAPELERELNDPLIRTRELVFDMAGVDYISSAGLRIFLCTQKAVSGSGSMKLIRVNPDVKEIFDITGFSGIMDIEQ